MSYKISREAPPKRPGIANALKDLSVGNECLVFNISQRLTVANTMTRLKKRGYIFTAKIEGINVKVWRVK